MKRSIRRPSLSRAEKRARRTQFVSSILTPKEKAREEMERLRAHLRTVYTAWRYGDGLDPDECKEIEALVSEGCDEGWPPNPKVA